MNSTFRARWLASSGVISQVLFTSEQPTKNKMAFVGILSQIKLLFGPLVIQLVWYILKQLFTSMSLKVVDIREFKIHYGGLLLRLLRPWGTRLTTPFPPQTSSRLRFRCTATGFSVSTCLYKTGCVRPYSTFIRERLDQWQWFPSLVSMLHLAELRFGSQLLLRTACNLNSNHKTK